MLAPILPTWMTAIARALDVFSLWDCNEPRSLTTAWVAELTSAGQGRTKR